MTVAAADTKIDVTIWQHLSGTTWADVGSIDAWESLSWENRHLESGPWALTLPLDGESLRFTAPDAKKYLVTRAFRDEEPTGVIEHIGTGQSATGGFTLELSGLDAMALLADPLCWPKPGSPLSGQDVARYTATGAGQTVLADLISANLSRLYGGGVYAAQVPTPTVGGASVSVNQRFGNLLEVVARKCETAGLGIRVGLKRQSEGSTRADLTVEFYKPRDLSSRVFLSHAVGTLGTWSQSDDAPTATRAVAGGGGVGTERVFVRTIRTAAETEWGRRREVFIDARDTTSTTELTDRSNEELDGAVAQSSFDLQAVDAAGMRYAEHFTLGDSLTIELFGDQIIAGQVIPGLSKVDRLNAVVVTSDSNGVTVQLRPGNPDVTPLFKQAAIVRALRQQVRALRLEE